MSKIDVRCCCDPGRLLGTIDVPGIGKFEQSLLKVKLKVGEGEMPGYLGLEVSQYYSAGAYHVAVKSNDLPMSVWRRIEGFSEASPEEQLSDCRARAARMDTFLDRKVREFMEGNGPVLVGDFLDIPQK